MANQIRWYKRDPDAALNGMAVLTLEERGAYNTVLDLIYSRDGKVDDDDRFIAGWCRVDVRVWRRIRGRLIELGKLYVDETCLRNERADREVGKALLRVASAIDAGRASAAKREADRNVSNGLASTDVERTTQLPTTTSTTTSRQKPSPTPSPGAARAKDAIEIANELLAPVPTSVRADPRWRGFSAWIERLLDEGLDKADVIDGVSRSLPSLDGPPSTFEYFRPAIDRAANLHRRPRPTSTGAGVSTGFFQTYIANQLEIRRNDLITHVGADRLAALHAEFTAGTRGMDEVVADLRKSDWMRRPAQDGQSGDGLNA
jgi:uncharacterized protein YdaU (DUF1376 family)